MKKILLGTTALVAAGFIAGEARAEAEPIKLGLSGYYATSYVAILDEDDNAGDGGSGVQGDFVTQDPEVHFKGSTELENGMTVGVKIELEGQSQAADQIDETWAWVSGSWGNLRIGAEDAASWNLGAVFAPYGGNVFSAFSPYFNMGNAGNTAGFVAAGYNTNYHALAFFGDNNQLHYMTPDFNGFQLGISYAPDGSQDVRSPTVPPTAGLEDIWGFGGAYNGSFNDVSVSAGAGFTTSDTGGPGGPNPEAYGGGLVLGFGQWSFGGSYAEFNADLAGALEWYTWELGLTYNNGPWTFNLNFSEGDYTAQGDGLSDDTLDIYRLGASYAVGPGISWQAAIGYDDLSNNASGGAGNDYQSISVGAGMSISY